MGLLHCVDPFANVLNPSLCLKSRGNLKEAAAYLYDMGGGSCPASSVCSLVAMSHSLRMMLIHFMCLGEILFIDWSLVIAWN